MTTTTRLGLRERFDGALLEPGSEGFDEARRVWNAAIEARPRLIARANGRRDVQEAVRWAREHGVPLAVRGGGHSVNGWGVRDDGLVVDVSALRAVAVDPVTRTVRAGGGLTWADLDLATFRAGLATPGGSVSTTGVAGVTLSGGFGHLLRRYGLGVDNLRAVELVTAEGDAVRVDAERDPELLWGLRGGGGNFGVATALELDAHPVGPLVLGGPILWPLEQGPLVLRALRELAPDAPDELGVMLLAGTAPPLPFVNPTSPAGPVLGAVVSWCGDLAAGERALESVRRLGKPVADQVRPLPYRALQTLLDAGAAAGNHAYWRSHRFAAALDDAAVDTVVDLTASASSPMSILNGWMIGGAASRVAPDATAVGAREPGFELRLIAVWRPEDPAPDRHRAWVRDGWEALRPYSVGQFATFLSDEGPAGARRAYGERLERLRALKRRHDPDNVFDLNVNIPPHQEVPS